VGEVGLVTDIDVPLTDDDMPKFTILAQDMLAVEAVEAYAGLCREHGLHWQAEQVDKAIAEIRQWQWRNRDRLKAPDHAHVPAGEQR